MAREYIRQQEEKAGNGADQKKDIEGLGTRITEMEENAARLELKMDKAHRLLEAMMKLFLATTPNAPDMAPPDAEEMDVAHTKNLPSPMEEPCPMSIDGEEDALKGAAEEVEELAQQVGDEGVEPDSAQLPNQGNEASQADTEHVEDAYDITVAVQNPNPTTEVNKVVAPAAKVDQADQVM